MRTLSGTFTIFALLIGIPHSPHWPTARSDLGILILASSLALSGQSHPPWVCNVAGRGRGKAPCIPASVHNAGVSPNLKAA